MLQTGTLLQGRFFIVQQLAQGGIGAVYLATDQKFGSRVAVKERTLEHPELAEAFEREARILNTLHHPILPHVSDYFSEPGGHFLVMEYIEGEDLCEKLKQKGSFPVTDVIRWGLELLEGLDYLHSQEPPIIHRDIKPGNLKLTPRGNIVLLDFGLAKETSGNRQGVRSVFGYSRRYSPLEQIEGAGTDVRSDIFSLGATLYHLITGTAPADVLARASAIVAGRRDPLIPANEANPEVAPAVARVIGRALALDPEKRFESAAEMRSALESAVSETAETVAVIPAAEAIDDEEATLVAKPSPRDKVEDTAPIRASATPPPPRTEKTIPVIPRRNFTGINIQRTAFLAAILLLALLALGYVALNASRSPEQASDAISQPTKATPAESPTQEAQVEEKAAIPDPETNGAAENIDRARATEQEVAESSTPVDEPLKKQTTTAANKQQNADENSRQGVSRKRADMIEPDEPVRRQRRNDPIAERPRVVRRGERINEPPASAIEMIFTGIEPRRHRRMRRIYPY